MQIREFDSMRSVVKYKIKKLVPTYVWKLLSLIYESKRTKKFNETQFCFGLRNPDIKIFIIRRQPPAAGLFSNVYHVLQGIIYASERNMTPVVDMKNYSTEYSIFRRFNGTNNAWEYFFEPVSDIGLEEAYESKDVTLSKGNRIIWNENFGGRNLDFASDTEKLQFLKPFYNKHIILNQKMENYINFISKEFEVEDNNTLGVFLRGTTYISHPETGHAKQPKIDDVLRDVDDYLNSNAISRIFLSTDDIKFRTIFKDRYQDRIYPEVRIDNNSSFSARARKMFKIPSFVLAKNISYLSEIYLLSRFEYNIASLSNGSAILQLIKENNFKKNKIYNLGYH